MTYSEVDRPVMIALTGGRSTPVILGVLAVRPRAVEFVNSLDEKYKEPDIRTTLASMAALELTAPGLNVDAFNMQATYDACRDLVARHEGHPVVINLSGGTKVMALGAYAFAKEYGCPALYVNTNNQQVLDLTTSRPFPMPPLDIEGYLACFGRSPRLMLNEHQLSISLEEAKALTESLVGIGAPAFHTLDRIRSHDKGKGYRTITIKGYHPSADELKVWNLLVTAGILGEAKDTADGLRFILLSDVNASFLKGQWLEIFVWQQADRQRKRDGSRVFESTAFSFEILSDENGARKEIDVGLMVGGQMIHCSCKSGASNIWSASYLDELRSVSSLIGGRFCSRIFVTTCFPPTEGEGGFIDYQRFLNQAKAREIVVIAGDQLEGIGTLLTKEALDPTYRRA